MAMFPKKTEDEKLLASDRANLAAAQKKLATVLSREDAAASSSDRWAQWTAERDAAEAEVHRQTKLVGAREAIIQEAARSAADAEKLQQIESCRAANMDVKSQLESKVIPAVVALMTYARDSAAATVEASRLNAQLPPGTEPIEIGDFLGRELPRIPRKVLATEELLLWVNSSNGGLIGNQDNVTDNGDGTGFVLVGRSQKILCVKRRYASTTYYPATIFDHPGSFFSLLRLPYPDRPGVLFDGAHAVLEQVAKMPVNLPPPPKTTSSRIAQTELIPIDPWPPQGAGPAEAGRDYAA